VSLCVFLVRCSIGEQRTEDIDEGQQLEEFPPTPRCFAHRPVAFSPAVSQLFPSPSTAVAFHSSVSAKPPQPADWIRTHADPARRVSVKYLLLADIHAIPATHKNS
jgi:hypothetical protein